MNSRMMTLVVTMMITVLWSALFRLMIPHTVLPTKKIASPRKYDVDPEDFRIKLSLVDVIRWPYLLKTFVEVSDEKNYDAHNVFDVNYDDVTYICLAGEP